jgi:hypothetical protein
MKLIERAGLSAMWLHVNLLWWRWAHREISPLHPDVPKVMHRVRDLEAQLEGRM